METAKQITVFLDNKPGRLASILSELAHQKVNITALSVMDRTEHNVLRLVADDPTKTIRIIQGLNATCAETDVVLVELRNQPGALAHVCETLAAEHIHIDYAYCSSGGRNGKVLGIFKVSNADKAMKVLNSAAGTNDKRRLERRNMVDRRTYHKG